MPVLPFLVAALVKASLYTLCESVDVQGLEHLLGALASGKGVLTVSNHISVIDDPCALAAAMPLRYFLNSRTTRWTLGASDICFRSPPSAFFFRRGQVIETFRASADPQRAGIYQPAIDDAIAKLERGQWLHVFPEAKVHQHPAHELLRFRWGASRVLMEARGKYEVLPIWLEGFDDLMPLERSFPRFIPRFWGTRIRIIIGPSINSRIRPLVEAYHREKHASSASLSEPSASSKTAATGRQAPTGKEVVPRPPRYEGDTDDLARLTRIHIAAVLREEVERLGRATTDFGKPGKGDRDGKGRKREVVGDMSVA